MKNTQTLHTYICEDCGAVIQSVGKKKVLKCQRCYKRYMKYKYRAETPCSFYVSGESNTDIHNDVLEVERYNAKNGTRLSYGQYKFMLFLGALKRTKKARKVK